MNRSAETFERIKESLFYLRDEKRKRALKNPILSISFVITTINYKEIEDMCWLIDIALETSDKKLSIDSANPLIIQKAVEHLNNRRAWLLNSVKNDKHILEEILPLTASQGASIIALAMDVEGIPESPEKRIDVCNEIYKQAIKAGVSADNIFFDPLVIPLASNYTNGKIALETLQSLKNEFPEAKTTMGISNISFGLPQRSKINEALLISAISQGLDSAICDITNDGIRNAILLGQLISGNDK